MNHHRRTHIDATASTDGPLPTPGTGRRSSGRALWAVAGVGGTLALVAGLITYTVMRGKRGKNDAWERG